MPTTPRRTDDFDGYAEVAMHGPQGSKGSGEAILRQEAAGQRSFVTSDTLPTKVNSGKRADLEKAGVVFGDRVPGDELFTFVTLPAGWSKVPTDHSMWSKLVDAKGRVRVSMFYKAAFYDRDALLNVERRFGTQNDYDYQEANDGSIKVDVTDAGVVVFSSTESYTSEKYSTEYYEASTKASAAATAWLEEHYPNWRDPSEYWD